MDEEDDIDYDYEDDYDDEDDYVPPSPPAGNLENCLCGFSAAECVKREC